MKEQAPPNSRVSRCDLVCTMVHSGSDGEACIGGNPGCSNAVIPRIGASILGIFYKWDSGE